MAWRLTSHDEADKLSPPMERRLKEHLAFLELQIQKLDQEIMQNSLTKAERNHLQSEIRAAELALSYYRKAFEIEKKLAQTSNGETPPSLDIDTGT
jgi:hypothetical protein